MSNSRKPRNRRTSSRSKPERLAELSPWLATTMQADEAEARGADDPPFTGGFWFELLSDVPTPPLVWSTLLAARDGPVIPTEAERARALLQVAGEALADGGEYQDPEGLDVWACLAAATLDPTTAVGLADVGRPDDAAVFVRLNGVLADPAAAVCRNLAESLREEAA